LVLRATRRTPEQLKKSYYYTAYFSCPNCHRIYHDNKFKIENASSAPLFVEEPKGGYDVEIWTDGACVNNGRPTARASWAFVSKDYEEGGLVPGKQTNNRGEGLAVYHALLWAAKKGFKKIKLHTDSQITLHGVAKRPSLVKANTEIFVDIERVTTQYDLKIHFVKVLGHSGDVNNDRVDALANGLAANARAL